MFDKTGKLVRTISITVENGINKEDQLKELPVGIYTIRVAQAEYSTVKKRIRYIRMEK